MHIMHMHIALIMHMMRGVHMQIMLILHGTHITQFMQIVLIIVAFIYEDYAYYV